MSRPDPVVSSADTIRRDDVLRHYTAVCRCEWSEDEFTRTMTSDNGVIHGTVPDPLAALLAVGERDKAAKEQMHAHIAGLTDVQEELVAAGERDGRQIARLTEAVAVYADPRNWAMVLLEKAVRTSRALLAVGERDRRQIARLTEALEQIAGVDLVKYVGAPLLEVQRIARAVLAGEEDAP